MGSKCITYTNKFSLAQKCARVAWAFCYRIFFRPTPKMFFNGWRCVLLRMFGAKIGKGTIVHPSTRVWAPWNLVIGPWSAIDEDVEIYNVNRVEIGLHVIVSRGAFLCTASHNVRSPAMELITAPIILKEDAWVCAKALVMPGVELGSGSVVGAGAVVSKDVVPWTIVAGNPARVVGKREI